MNPLDPYDFVVFDIPSGPNKLGEMVTERVIVQNRMVPIMAQIVRSATRPVRLTQQYRLAAPAMAMMGDSMLDHLRERTQYDLEHGLREDAKKQGLAILTAITFDEQKLSGGGILFTAQATAMPLLDKGIEL